MKILINGLSARLGGGQTYLTNILRYLPQENNWEILLLCQDNLDLSGFPKNIERIPLNITLDNPWKRALWENTALLRLIKKLHIDIFFSPGGLLPAVRLPKEVKTIVTFQNMLPFDKTQRNRYPFGYRRIRDWLLERGLSSAMRKADLVIFISDFAKQFIHQKLGVLRGKTVMIPHGLDSKFLVSKNAIPMPHYVTTSDFFLYVSFIDYYKSQIEVVRAYAKVKKQTSTNAKLILVGTGNPEYIAKLIGEIKDLNIENDVCLLGNIPHHDLPAIYQHAKINIFASCTENCPNILLEMMASGRPCLVSNRGPMPEFGRNFVTYFNPDNVEELTQRWIDLLSPSEQINDDAKQAVAHVSSISWDKTALETWKAISNV